MAKKRKITEPSEYAEQCAIFKRVQLYAKKYPELRFLIGSMNRVRLTICQAVKAKNAGMKKGMPDIFLPVEKGRYCGLWIELKRKKGSKILPEQIEWKDFLLKQGYLHCFCYGADEALTAIISYLEREV